MADENPYAPPEANIEVPLTEDTELAGRGARLGGAFIDGLILSIVFWGAVFLFGSFDSVLKGNTSASMIALMFLGWLGIFLVFNGYLLATKGQTIGKLAVGTRIVSSENGRILPLWKLIGLRYVPFYALGYVPIVGPLLGLVNILLIFRQDRRCLHDHVAGTKVIVATASPGA